MRKKKTSTPVANTTGVKPETIKAAADVVVNDAENVSNTVSTENEATTTTSESTVKNGTEEGVENNTENGATTTTPEITVKNGTEEGVENNTENGTTTITEKVVNETFAFNGKKYTLAPFVKKLQVAGRVHTREEILNNKEIMSSLIIGNSPFIKKS